MKPFRIIFAILAAATLLSTLSRDTVAADSPRIGIGTAYADATQQLAVASIVKASPMQMMPRDPDVVLEFFAIDRSTVLIIGRSAATKLIKSISICYIPDNRTYRGQVVQVAVRSIEFRSDRSYVVHFEAPSEKPKPK